MVEEKISEEAVYVAKDNRKYKDSVFTDLFSGDLTAKENQVSLYNALHGTEYSADTIEIGKIALESILYMNFRNDVSLQMQEKCLLFAEHQSTINENMCVRFLMYAGRTYEQLIPVKERYGRKRLRITRPEFYVFYNGVEEFPLEKEMKLSDSFKGEDSDNIYLELTVRVININLAKKHPILEKCPVLKEYMEFVETVRSHRSRGEEDALKQAIQECIEQGILAEYLTRRGSEVYNMLVAEYDYELDIKTQRAEAKEEGKEEGREEGREVTLVSMFISLMKKGKSSFEIADIFDMSMEEVNYYIDVISRFAPDYDVDAIVKFIMNNRE